MQETKIIKDSEESDFLMSTNSMGTTASVSENSPAFNISNPGSAFKRPLIIEEEIASKIVKDICCGLNELHKQSYIHRDLKPENILLNKSAEGEFTAKIADFGLTAEVHTNVFTG